MSNRDWFRIFERQAVFTPFARVRHVYYSPDGRAYNYHDYYVFGLRVARIHV